MTIFLFLTPDQWINTLLIEEQIDITEITRKHLKIETDCTCS